MQPCNRIYYSKNLLKAGRVSSGIPLFIRSSKLYLQPLIYIRMWWPAIVQAGWVPTQPGQWPVTTWVYKLEATNTVWSSWWWVVCRLKHVEPSINFWNNKFYYKVASCQLFLRIQTTMHGSWILNLYHLLRHKFISHEDRTAIDRNYLWFDTCIYFTH